MTVLQEFDENGIVQADAIRDGAQIASVLKQQSVLFERWDASEVLAADADQDAVLSAYNTSVQKLKSNYDIQSMDVVAIRPDNPQKAEFRQKFLAEHTHADFEIRFFVEGSGLFYLHIENKVYLILCEQGDLISVPANTTHWFDMGVNPNFKCIRLFTTDEGWVGNFTGNDIAKKFPSMDDFVGSVK
ncbi:MAG: cupin [Gammaproteobacteria bacterium]|nr:cupin [Gammaproteobacteria bacterium]